MCFASHSKIPEPVVLFLNFASFFYKSVAFVRISLKSLGRLQFPQVYVVSVDNLSFGGTGKTPLIISLGKFLQERSIPFAVISRGYKSKLEKAGAVVSAQHGVADVGDEAVIMKRRFPGQLVLVGRDRIRSLRRAMAGGVKIVILDDGFQTAHLVKDFRIMLLNPAHPYFYLRHFRFLKGRSDCLLLHRARAEAGRNAVSGWVDFELTGFFDRRGEAVSVTDSPIFAFSALGDNERFKGDLGAFHLCGFKAFPDHYTYTAADMTVLDGLRLQAGADYLVCTEKDFIKIADLPSGHLPLLYAKNRIKLDEGLFERILIDARRKNRL
jgi:tetraacyldisaccharide 4'-kinase